MKILLLGKNGQVGRELQRTLLPLGQVVALGRSELNFDSTADISRVLRSHAPDLIVNAAAYTAVDRAESEVEAAFRVNAEAVRVIADYARERDACLVHYSTDYVFDGRKDAPYVEQDTANPQSVYGRSKREGEIAIEESGCNFLVFRTSWVFSVHGINFIKTILRLAAERTSLGVVDDQFGAPTSAELISDVTALAIAAYYRGGLAAGTYHLAASGRTSWYGLACHILEYARRLDLPLMLSPEGLKAITTADYPLPAKRPANSLLNTNALTSRVGLSLPDWRLHVDRTLDQISGEGKKQ
ncbi:dTDP-4-dehydrorhamnose reductase [Rhizobium sp. YTU87027]|uniref:dTDP-4-dehydrorhamnose reductase n=1 Tax=Rhizobium sp. YTU87027 TaxID=3417741 RepID=UPI003D696D8F